MMYNEPRRPSMFDAMSDVASVLPSVVADLNLDQKVKEWAVLSLWPQMVDPPFDTLSQAKRLRWQKEGVSGKGRRILEVAVVHAAAKSELQFLSETYRQRLNQRSAQTGLVIDEIRLFTGPVERQTT